MPKSKHGLVSEQDTFWHSIRDKLDHVAEEGRSEAWYIFLHLLRAMRGDELKVFLVAMRTMLQTWEYREREAPFLPDAPEQASSWVEALNEVRRFENDVKFLAPSLGLADVIAMCFEAARLGDQSMVHKLRAIARQN